ncbi:lyase family protein [Williamsia maris]|uniref:3-carboxy-cis,cis-muconate cycloisomerase n=1 Tax=Williamsia maris TaxID=72806 RepID=A0ABT1HF31_9NOCA|nr:lyase family protein [Williamsia maris]MCP2175575.1 3-carboxy-cis,cis-muconate cycloisomerase [Williamsia maris]
MTDIFWPGDHRAGDLVSASSFLQSMVAVERAWLAAMVTAGVAPPEADDDLADLVGADDVDRIAVDAEGGGNPAIPTVALLRSRLADRHAEAARWLHRGLTSQDVVDTALVLCLRAAVVAVEHEIREQVTVLADLADRHVDTVMVGRTLTQHAVPLTFGVKVSGWLDGVLDAATLLSAARERLPVQIGGAVGINSAATELLAVTGARTGARTGVADVVADVADRLGLVARRSWHTTRSPLTSLADALVGYSDVLGHVAADVATLSRPEIGEVAEGQVSGRGGSSTMPNKNNPVLAVLIRRAALAAPHLGATVHIAAATAVDERPDGAWHVEWDTHRTLARRSVVAASQATELLGGLQIDVDRMSETLTGALPGVLAERSAMRTLTNSPDVEADPSHYLGAASTIVGDVVSRARTYLEEHE